MTTVLADENTDIDPVLTVYHVHPNPYSEPPVEDTAEDQTTETTKTSETTANNSGTVDDTSQALSSSTPGTTTQTTKRRPLCSTLKLDSTTAMYSTEATPEVMESTESTSIGTTAVNCEDDQDSVVEEAPSRPYSVYASVENDPIEKLPEDQWTICGSKYFNIWTLSTQLLTFKNGDRTWVSGSFEYGKKNNLEHTDKEEQKLTGYIWVYVSNINYCVY